MENSQTSRSELGGLRHAEGEVRVYFEQSAVDAKVVFDGPLPSELDVDHLRKLRGILAEGERRLIHFYDQRIKAKNGCLF